jgi:hypothetical protein
MVWIFTGVIWDLPNGDINYGLRSSGFEKSFEWRRIIRGSLEFLALPP